MNLFYLLILLFSMNSSFSNSYNSTFIDQYREFINSDRMPTTLHLSPLTPPHHFFDENGAFNVDTFNELLSYLSTHHIISNPHFFNADILSIKNVTGIVQGGNSYQIFILKITKERSYKYIIRNMSSWQEALRLNRALQNQRLQSYINEAFRNKEFPILVFPVHLLQLNSEKKENFLSISLYVKGKTLGELLKGYASLLDKKLLDAFYCTGRALAYLHNYFMTGNLASVSHEDFNLNNIIIDKDNRIFFVDNEGISHESHQLHHPFGDLEHFLAYSFIWILDNLSINREEKNKILKKLAKKFLSGYLMTFTREQRKKIYPHVNSFIMNKINSYGPSYAATMEAVLTYFNNRHFALH